MLILLIILGATLLWVAVWSFYRFRFRTDRDPSKVRVRARIVSLGLFVLSLLFPPMAEVGIWTPSQPFNPYINQIDRGKFGYIPAYMWIGYAGVETKTPDNWSISYDRHGLLGKAWQIDGIFLIGQWVIGLLWALPFLRAVKRDGSE